MTSLKNSKAIGTSLKEVREEQVVGANRPPKRTYEMPTSRLKVVLQQADIGMMSTHQYVQRIESVYDGV